ncbi:DUF4231 domain-containing protein [Vibrio alginolyticus]|uniref:SLATT domain-containing protein n=1 Tax=Vibrio alginolyticus TaxID=663 RepID=UPI002FE654EC
MSIRSETEHLKQEVDSRISTLKCKVKSQKRKISFLNGLSVTLGAIITLTLGLDLSVEMAQHQKNFALFLGALLTIVNGWSTLFDYKKLWIRQKTTLLNLYQIQNELNYRIAKAGNICVDDLFAQYMTIWEKGSEEWREIVSAIKSPSEAKPQEEVSQ